MIDYRTFTEINKLLNNFIFVRIDIRKSNRNSSERIVLCIMTWIVCKTSEKHSLNEDFLFLLKRQSF